MNYWNSSNNNQIELVIYSQNQISVFFIKNLKLDLNRSKNYHIPIIDSI